MWIAEVEGIWIICCRMHPAGIKEGRGALLPLHNQRDALCECIKILELNHLCRCKKSLVLQQHKRNSMCYSTVPFVGKGRGISRASTDQFNNMLNMMVATERPVIALFRCKKKLGSTSLGQLENFRSVGRSSLESA